MKKSKTYFLYADLIVSILMLYFALSKLIDDTDLVIFIMMAIVTFAGGIWAMLYDIHKKICGEDEPKEDEKNEDGK